MDAGVLVSPLTLLERARAIASEREREREPGRRQNGSAAFFSAGSPSGRHMRSDVTNAANAPACSRYGPLERARPIGARRPVSSAARRPSIQRGNLNFCLLWFFTFTQGVMEIV